MDNDKFNEWLYGKAGFCGCFAANEGARLLRDVLRLSRDMVKCDDDEYAKRMNDMLPSEGIQHWFLSWLTDLDLLEHGCTIRCSWPTDFGREMLSYLDKLTDDEIDNQVWLKERFE